MQHTTDAPAYAQTLEQDTMWQAYYTAQEPAQRRLLLEQTAQQLPADGMNVLRFRLWQLRYEDTEHPGRPVDKMLWQCVNLLYVYKTSASAWARTGAKREVREAMEEMGLPLARACGEEGKQVWSRECRNAAVRYFAVCAQDKAYRKRLFGIATLDETACREKLAQDAWALSSGLAQRLDMQEELAPFCAAVKEAFFSLYAESAALWEQSAQQAGRSKKPVLRAGTKRNKKTHREAAAT